MCVWSIMAALKVEREQSTFRLMEPTLFHSSGFFVDSLEFQHQPIDYVGESPLGGGSFTYKLTIVDLAKTQFMQTAIKD